MKEPRQAVRAWFSSRRKAELAAEELTSQGYDLLKLEGARSENDHPVGIDSGYLALGSYMGMEADTPLLNSFLSSQAGSNTRESCELTVLVPYTQAERVRWIINEYGGTV